VLPQDLPGVEVTLVHGGPRLLPALTPKASAAAEAWLRSKGCKVRGLSSVRLNLIAAKNALNAERVWGFASAYNIPPAHRVQYPILATWARQCSC
jgi:NADPH-dependent 2,4-dienoyl-CoA reductase/sulfur reductase-like enzyme